VMPAVNETTTGPYYAAQVVYRSRLNGIILAVNGRKGGPVFQIDAGAGKVHTITSSKQLPVNRWSHLVATFDGSTMKLYVNGAAGGSSKWTLPPLYGLEAALGRDGDACDGRIPSLTGSLDAFAFYSHTLTPTQVKTHYRAGATPAPPAQSADIWSGVVASNASYSSAVATFRANAVTGDSDATVGVWVGLGAGSKTDVLVQAGTDLRTDGTASVWWEAYYPPDNCIFGLFCDQHPAHYLSEFGNVSGDNLRILVQRIGNQANYTIKDLTTKHAWNKVVSLPQQATPASDTADFIIEHLSSDYTTLLGDCTRTYYPVANFGIESFTGAKVQTAAGWIPLGSTSHVFEYLNQQGVQLDTPQQISKSGTSESILWNKPGSLLQRPCS
jgi:hypothetical protein